MDLLKALSSDLPVVTTESLLSEGSIDLLKALSSDPTPLLYPRGSMDLLKALSSSNIS
mgnify:CR=1 FL=1